MAPLGGPPGGVRWPPRGGPGGGGDGYDPDYGGDNDEKDEESVTLFEDERKRVRHSQVPHRGRMMAAPGGGP